MLKKVQLAFLGACGFTVLGCADAVAPVSPARIAPPVGPSASWAEYGDAPSYEDPSEVPSSYAGTTIHRLNVSVKWEADVAHGYVTTEYLGNRSETFIKLRTRKGTADAGGVDHTLPHQVFFPEKFLKGTPVQYRVGGTCGHVANLSASMNAATVLLMKSSLTTWSAASDSREASAAQPDCTCDGGSKDPVERMSYDPYSDVSTESDVSTSSTGDCTGSGDGSSGGAAGCYEVLVHHYRSNDGGATWEYTGTTSMGIICY